MTRTKTTREMRWTQVQGGWTSGRPYAGRFQARFATDGPLTWRFIDTKLQANGSRLRARTLESLNACKDAADEIVREERRAAMPPPAEVQDGRSLVELARDEATEILMQYKAAELEQDMDTSRDTDLRRLLYYGWEGYEAQTHDDILKAIDGLAGELSQAAPGSEETERVVKAFVDLRRAMHEALVDRAIRVSPVKIRLTHCACGQPLPIHLAEVADGDADFQHVCSCRRAYKLVDGEFVASGTARNPFAEYDEAQAKKKSGPQ